MALGGAGWRDSRNGAGKIENTWKIHVSTTHTIDHDGGVAFAKAFSARRRRARAVTLPNMPEPIERARALSLRPAWAWAVAHAGKRIENRTWTTSYRGRIYIHASTKTPSDDERRELVPLGMPQRPPSRAIVACAELVNVLTVDQVHRRWVGENQMRWAIGPFCWMLRDVIVLPEPIPMSGKLGLWYVDSRGALPTGIS